MKNILIATPCLYGKVDAYYVHSLCESIKLGLKHGFHIKAVFLAQESILPMARNELINLCYKEDYTAMVFIDDDEYWDAEHLIEVLKSPKDVVTVPVVNKGDTKIQFNINLPQKFEKDVNDGYIKASTTGTGFLKLSKTVVEQLCNSSPELNFRGKSLRTVCEYTQLAGDFVGEDIALSRKITELGHTIWVYPHHTVRHLGTKMYRGDFKTTVLDKYNEN